MDNGDQAIAVVPESERAALEAKEPRLAGNDACIMTEAQARKMGVI
jgi:hypothetical protein